MAIPGENPLAGFLKSPSGSIDHSDWNGLVQEVGGLLSVLQAKAAGFDAVSATAIEVLLQRINDVLGPAYDQVQEQADEIAARLAQLNGTGVSADAVLETALRLFLTPSERSTIASAASVNDIVAVQDAAGCVTASYLFTSGF